jgi:hypothetical protein
LERRKERKTIRKRKLEAEENKNGLAEGSRGVENKIQ